MCANDTKEFWQKCRKIPVVSRVDLVSGSINPEEQVETAVWAEERSMKILFV